MVHKRIHYIDWLRVLAILLLFPFHTWRVFNFNDPFYVKSAQTSVALSYVIGYIDRWHMPLLFVLAGMSTFLALGKRSTGTYAFERVKRLLVPFVVGFFVLIPPQTWYGARFHGGSPGSFWHYISSGAFLSLDMVEKTGSDYFGGMGFGHLWFILYLFLISLLVLPLVAFARTERGSSATRRVARFLANPVTWLIPAFLLWFGEGLPDPIDKSFFLYLVCFLLGFAIVSDEAFAQTAERYRWPVIVTGLVVTGVYVATTSWRDSLADPSWALMAVNMAGMLATWCVIVGALGLGRRHLDRPSRFLAYNAESSYPVYLLHQTVIVVAAFYLVQLPLAWSLQWLLLLIVAVVLTFALYEVVRRTRFLRFAFGMRPKVVRVPAVQEQPEIAGEPSASI
jgi:glucan biosynthesis protein C